MRTRQRRSGGARIRLLLILSCFGGVITLGQASIPADSPDPIVRIEEDWSLEISEPATDETSPQITNTMSPECNLTGHYGVFEINHGTQPDYDDGGLELQIWQGTREVIYRRNPDPSRLSYSNEVVKFTLAMSTFYGFDGMRRIRFQVKNGSSQTWGAFGSDGTFRCTSDWTEVDNFSGYSPRFSVNNSKIGYASFRVRKYAQVAVRYYRQSGVVSTDTTERVAFQYDPNAVISE